jgi:hypothetical protein
MAESNALPACMYRDPAIVVEQNQLQQMGCQACDHHGFLLQRVICTHERVTNYKRVPGIGQKCKYFELKVIK